MIDIPHHPNLCLPDFSNAGSGLPWALPKRLQLDPNIIEWKTAHPNLGLWQWDSTQALAHWQTHTPAYRKLISFLIEVIAAYFDHYHHIWLWILNRWCERRVKCICAEIFYNNASFLLSWCRYQGQSIPSPIRSNVFRSLGKNSSTYAHYHQGWVPCVQYVCWLWCREKLTCAVPHPPTPPRTHTFFFSSHVFIFCLSVFAFLFHCSHSFIHVNLQMMMCFRSELNDFWFFNIEKTTSDCSFWGASWTLSS